MAVPKLFRVALQVADLDQTSSFYAKLLDDPGIPIPRGSRRVAFLRTRKMSPSRKCRNE